MRLDLFLSEKLMVKSRTKAKEMIEKGLVVVNKKTATKPSFDVLEGDIVEIKEELKYVSKGGEKLEKGIIAFNYGVLDKVFLDVGASNGGFTDCLIKFGAKKVYAIDVGENQLEEEIAKNQKVVVMDKTNARFLEKENFKEEELFAVSDLSFISLTLVIPCLSKIVEEMLLLVKPQFECGKKALNKNGIVKSDKDRLDAVLKVRESLQENGFDIADITIGASGKEKNTEYVILAKKGKGIEKQKLIDKFRAL